MAMLMLNDSMLYAISLNNGSDIDMWPYLFWMDVTRYTICPILLPDPAVVPPLQKGGQLMISMSNIRSEMLAFMFNDSKLYNSGFLKLSLSTAYMLMGLVKQGSPTSMLQPTEPPPAPAPMRNQKSHIAQLVAVLVLVHIWTVQVSSSAESAPIPQYLHIKILHPHTGFCTHETHANPYPYPRKPLPLITGRGFPRYRYGLL